LCLSSVVRRYQQNSSRKCYGLSVRYINAMNLHAVLYAYRVCFVLSVDGGCSSLCSVRVSFYLGCDGLCVFDEELPKALPAAASANNRS
jgi:hypothetical protein